jgi:hypothetical protein
MKKVLHKSNIVLKFMLFMMISVALGKLFWSSGISYSQGQAWENPRLLSADAFAWFPDVAADQTGSVHVVWSSGVPGYDTVNYMFYQSEAGWGNVNDIVALPQVAGSEATRPSLMVDANNILHMTYRSTVVYYASAPTEKAGLAPAWKNTSIVSDPASVGYFSRMAVDGLGRLHLVVTWNVPTLTCPICYHVFYRYSDDYGITWSNPVDLSKSSGAAKPQILVDRQNNVHVVWERGVGGSYGRITSPASLMYVASYDRGQSWLSPVQLSIPTEQGLNVAIGSNNEDQLMIVWLGIPDDQIYYQVSRDAGRTWTTPSAILNVWGAWTVYPSYLDDYSLATDSAGNIHLVLSGRTEVEQRDLSILHLVWDGIKWSGPEVIKSLVGDVPEWPRIAVGLGNRLHVVWFERDKANIWDPDNGRYAVWYASGLASAPSLPTAEIKRSTATLVATPSQQVTSAPTEVLLSTAIPLNRQRPENKSLLGVGKPVYSEIDYLVLLGKILILPGSFLLISLVIIAIRRR